MTQVFLICTPLTDEIFSLIDVQDVGDSIQSLVVILVLVFFMRLSIKLTESALSVARISANFPHI